MIMFTFILMALALCLNEVRPRRPEQSTSPGYPATSSPSRLNEVRPRRPEQSECLCQVGILSQINVSMKSGLEGRNNVLALAR